MNANYPRRIKSGEKECCMSYSDGRRFTAFVSSIFGVVIVGFAFRCKKLHLNEALSLGRPLDYDPDPTPFVIMVGLGQVFSSVCLLFNLKSRNAAKVWIGGHLVCVAIAMHMFIRLISTQIEGPLGTLMTVAGVNLCINIFMTLAMIELIGEPYYEKIGQTKQL